MTEEKPYISPPLEADGNYKYYLVAGGIPVRIKFSERGHECLGEVADKDNPGQLKVHNHMIGKIMKDEDVEEITKEEFVQACGEYAEYYKRLALKKSPLR